MDISLIRSFISLMSFSSLCLSHTHLYLSFFLSLPYAYWLEIGIPRAIFMFTSFHFCFTLYHHAPSPELFACAFFS